MKVKACFLAAILVVAIFGFQVGVKSVGADETFETVFESGMDLLFIRDSTTPYGQILLDTSVWENHGYMYPKTTPYSSANLTFGKYGYALDFDGSDDYVKITSCQGLPSDEITVMAWIKIDTHQNYRRIVNHEWDAEGSWIFYTDVSGVLRFGIVENSTKYQASYAGLETDTWYHVAGVYNASYVTVYVDGEEGNSSAISSATLDDGGNVYISDSGSSNFDGIIDELRVFPYALTQDHIYNYMITPIAEFKDYWFSQSYAGGGWYEGTVDGYTDFRGNDPELPEAYNNATYPNVEIDSIRYIPSFQNYRYYCSLYSTVQIQDSYPYPFEFADWDFIFYKNGLQQAIYRIEITRDFDNTTSPEEHYLQIDFKNYYSSSWHTLSTEYLTYSCQSLGPMDYDIIVDAWVGSDNHHFTTRVTLNGENVSESMYGWEYWGTAGHSEVNYYAQYSFDLVDEDGNVRIIDWFDGWVTSIIKIINNSYTIYGFSSTFGIWQHGWIGLIFAVLLGLYVIGSLITGGGYTYITRPLIFATTGFSLPSNPAEAWVTEGGVNPLIHGITAAFNAVMEPVVDALRPLANLANEIGKSIINAMMNFADQAINFVDAIFTAAGWPNGFSQILLVIDTWKDWMWSSFSYTMEFIQTVFTFLSSFIGKMLNTLSTVVTQWATIIQGVFGALGDSYSTGINLWNDLGLSTWVILIAILYPMFLIFLWDEKGFDAMLNHVKMVLDILAYIANVFITIIQVFIALIERVIESIPVVE